MANSLISVVSMAKSGSFSQDSGRDLGRTEGQVFLRAVVPCGRQLSVGIEAKLRLSVGVHTLVSPFVTWEGHWLGSVLGGPSGAGCGKGIREGAWAQPSSLCLGSKRRKLAPLPVCSERSVTIDGQVWGCAESSASRFWSLSSLRVGCGLRKRAELEKILFPSAKLDF